MSDNGSDWGQYRAVTEVLRDLPELKPEIIDLLRKDQLRLHAGLIPIDRKAAAIHLAKLRTRYPERSMPMVALKMIVNEDLNDIAEYPEHLVERACKAWRDNPANDWAPKSMAQLMQSVKYEFNVMKRDSNRIGILIKQSEAKG